MQLTIRRRSRRIVAAAILGSLPTMTRANTTYTWSGGNAGTGYFDVGSNWAGNVAPPTNGTSDLVFGSVNLHAPNQPYIEFNYNVSSITFNASSQAYGIGSSNNSTINISSGGITDAATNAESIGVGLVLDTSQTWNVSGTQLTVSNATLNNTSSSVLSKIGGGILNLGLSTSTASSIGEIAQTTGTTLITSGTLGLTTTANYALYVTGGAFNISGGAVVNTSAGMGYAAVIDTGASALVTGSGSQLNTPTSNANILVGATGPATLNVSSQAVVNCNTDFIGRIVGNSQLYISSATLNSANTYFGSTTGSTGTGTVTGSGATLNATTLLSLGGGSNGVGNLTISNGGTANAGSTSFVVPGSTINISQGTLNTGSVSGKGAITATDPSSGYALNINGSSGTNTYSGSFTGTGTLNKSGGSTQILTGSGSNTLGALKVHAGSFNISAGTLTLSQTGTSFYQTGGQVTISNGAVVNATVGGFGSSQAIDGAAGTTMTVTGSGTQFNAGYEFAVGNLNQGALNVSNGGLVSATTFFDVGNSVGSSSVAISSGGAVTAPTVDLAVGAGATGTITVDGAGSSFNASSSISLGGYSSSAGTGIITITNGAAVNSPSVVFDSGTSSINVSGGTLNAGSLSSFNTGYGSITLTDPTGGYALNINASSGTNTYSGTISGTGTINKTGGATQILSGILACGAVLAQGGTLNLALANSSSNSIDHLSVTAGTIQMTSGSLKAASQTNYDLFISNGAFNLSGGAQLTLAAGPYSNAVIDSNGLLNVAGPGTTLSCTNTSYLATLYVGVSAGLSNGLTVTNGGSVSSAYFITAGGLTSGVGASVTINSAGTLTAPDVDLGSTLGTTVTASVDGAGSILTATSRLAVGGSPDSSYFGGSGYLTISNNGAVNAASVLFCSNLSTVNVSGGTLNAGGLNSNASGNGAVVLTDPSSGYALNINASSGTNTYSGTFFGNGTLNKSGGSTQIYTGNGSIGTLQIAGGSFNITGGTLTLITTRTSLMTSGGTIVVNGGATLDASASNNFNYIDNGSMTVTGSGTKFLAGHNFDVCESTGNNATLNVSSNAQMSTGILEIPYLGNGFLTVTSGAQVSTGLLVFAGTSAQPSTITISAGGTLIVSGKSDFYDPISPLNVSGGTFTTGALSGSGGSGLIYLTDPAVGAALTINDTIAGDISTYSGSIYGSGTINKTGASTQILSGPTHVGAINISTGVIQIAGLTNTLLVASLTIGSAGKLDMTSNSADISGSSLASITALAKTGFANGSWNGTGGIVSTTASADTSHLTALGVIQNNQSGGVFFYTGHPFEGVVPGPGDVLVKYTYYGDTNFDGKVDGSDYTRIDSAYILDKTNPTTATGWFNGDFNYDGVINGSDYTLIDNAFNRQGAQLTAEVATAAAVPEPASLTLIGFGLSSLLRLRRRS